MSTEHEPTGRHSGLSRRRFLAAPASASAGYKSDWQRAADNFNHRGALAAARGSPYVSRSRA
jgi:hypothetical protein